MSHVSSVASSDRRTGPVRLVPCGTGHLRTFVRVLSTIAVTAGAVAVPLVGLDVGVAAGDPPAGLYEQAVLDDSPVSYWQLQETTGSTAEDEMGLNDGDISSGITKGVSGPMSGHVAMRFDGANATGVNVPGITVNSNGQDLDNAQVSVEAWVKTTDDDGTIFRWRSRGYELAIRDGAAAFGWWANDNFNPTVQVTGGTVDDGKWHHVVGLRSSTAGRIYVDGVLVDEESTTTAISYTPDDGGTAIGRDGDAGDGFRSSLDGDMAHVAVYDAPLSAARVTAHMVASSRPVGGPQTEAELRGPENCAQQAAGGGGGRRMQTDYPVDTGTGNFWHSFAGMSMPGRGPGIGFNFTYNSSAAAENSQLGYGWSHSYGMRTITSGNTVRVVQAKGAEVAFQLVNGTYIAPPRVTATLSLSAGVYTFVPACWTRYEFDAGSGKLLEISHPNEGLASGQYRTIITYPSASSMVVTAASGNALTFALAGGLIDTVTDNSATPRVIDFGYNGAGELTSFTDVEGGITTFTYSTSGHRVETMRFPKRVSDFLCKRR
jgi:YD repeat-containing protein